MKKRKKKGKGLGQAGATMAELIVTFALLGIFLLAAALVTGTYFRMFTRTREYGNQKILSSTLTDMIEYELGAAGKEIVISSDGGMIDYQNSMGIAMQMKKNEDGYLQISVGSGEDSEQKEEMVYYQAVYGQNRIARLTFEPFEGKGENCLVKVTLALESALFTDMTSESSGIVYCYNLDADDLRVRPE